MSGVYLFLVVLAAILAMIVLIARFRWHPFIVLLLAAYGIGLCGGLSVEVILGCLKTGFGGAMGNIGIVIIAGATIGVILEKSGGALTMAESILRIVGPQRSALTMSITGYVVSIPVFCDSGFVILTPINRALARRSQLSMAVMATALSAGLYATHCLVPPTPGPIIMADTLGANLGFVILLGLLVSIPAMGAGLLYALKISSRFEVEAPGITADEARSEANRPTAFAAFTPIVFPIFLIAMKSIAGFPAKPFGEGGFAQTCQFIGNPVTALLIGVGLAIVLLLRGQPRGTAFSYFETGIRSAASILAITAAGGALGQVIKELPLADALAGSLLHANLGLLLPFLFAALLKSAMGSSTVAMIVTSTLLAPLLGEMGLASDMAKVLAVLAIGGGAMTVSHANDSYFWVVSQFSGMDTATAYKTQTGMTLVQGIATILVVLILGAIFL